MHLVETERRAAALSPLKYHGKWPFVRLLGCQEPASVALSLANLWAHAHGFARLRRAWSARACPLKVMWSVYAALSVNAWVWSSVFHSRDTRTTEVLDYFSADALLFFALFSSLVRALRLLHTAQWLPVAAALVCGLTALFWHMLRITFDYGLNVKVRRQRGGGGCPAHPGRPPAGLHCGWGAPVRRAGWLDAGEPPPAEVQPPRARSCSACSLAARGARLPAPLGGAGCAQPLARLHASAHPRLVEVLGGRPGPVGPQKGQPYRMKRLSSKRTESTVLNGLARALQLSV